VPSVFSRIIAGELPARMVHEDDRAVAFLSIAPLQIGHTLVVPRQEIDHWLDLPPDLLDALMRTSQTVGHAIQQAFSPGKVGMMLAGLEVPHVHVHLVPIATVRDMDFANADPDPDPAAMDDAAARIRAALAGGG
jgi:histidine triad (HIT) family protein